MPALLPRRHGVAFARLAGVVAAFAAAAVGAVKTTAEADAWRDARQLVLVVTADWNADRGELRRYSREDKGAWKKTGDTVTVTIGRAGSAWGLGLHGAHDGPQKKEGDGRSPAGAFHLGEAFGYADSLRSLMPYTPMQASHYCIDVAASPLYNRIVDTRVVGEAAIAGSTEPMRRDIHVDGDVRYKSGFVILHNAQHVAGSGSCIFAHLWRSPGEPTSGCTAMDEAQMQGLLAWLDPARKPLFVLLPQAEFEHLKKAWALPALDGQP